ncbi:hypothetical protein BC939DRAFT_457478 [Gamsiella multidivaricata]|uniref:uncharacterized protein n=1 Tax=Gamsiella multidivaricata TaxID=101098 RepID=UPI0022201647|nr:uncharacterized protein BC939DRAFT_457478 [Gamsiella multidivaricata]KAI7820498.1 hypothetical protein BC939DRAFT_457478 [Gamsiella multidivaricata]
MLYRLFFSLSFSFSASSIDLCVVHTHNGQRTGSHVVPRTPVRLHLCGGHNGLDAGYFVRGYTKYRLRAEDPIELEKLGSAKRWSF